MKRQFRHRSTIRFTLLLAVGIAEPITKTVYLRPNRNCWDGSWYTEDINKAKVWRIRGMAEAWIRGRNATDLSRLSPEVIDPRTVAGYKDKAK